MTKHNVKQKIYLAGLISTTYPASLAWREHVADELRPWFEIVTPLRGKRDLHKTTLDGGITDSSTTSRCITLRDREDVRSADIILANLNTFDAPRPLVGTLVELGWAWDDHKPIIAVCDTLDYLMRRHPFISEFVAKYCASVNEAVDFIRRYYGGVE